MGLCYVVSIYFVGFYFMYTVVSNLSSVIVNHYLLNVSARCKINLLALNSLRLPSFELSNSLKLGDDTGMGFWLNFHSKI